MRILVAINALCANRLIANEFFLLAVEFDKLIRNHLMTLIAFELGVLTL